MDLELIWIVLVFLITEKEILVQSTAFNGDILVGNWSLLPLGAQYTNCDADYTGQGVDQLKVRLSLRSLPLQECISSILFKPTDRRIVLSAWNPAGTLFEFISCSFTAYGSTSMPHVLPILRI